MEDIYIISDGLTGDTLGYTSSKEDAIKIVDKFLELEEYPEPYYEGPVKFISNAVS